MNALTSIKEDYKRSPAAAYSIYESPNIATGLHRVQQAPIMLEEEW